MSDNPEQEGRDRLITRLRSEAAGAAGFSPAASTIISTLLEQIVSRFALSRQEESLLLRSIKTFNRTERRYFFQNLKPRERAIRAFIRDCYEALSPAAREQWLAATVDRLLQQGGDPAVIDGYLMDVIGRLTVYRTLRERAEREGARLKALNQFGGLSMVLYLFVIIAAVIILLTYR